jgi:hypothetical protein
MERSEIVLHTWNRASATLPAHFCDAGIARPTHRARQGKEPDGNVRVTDWPYRETNEHIGGFWILEAAVIHDALAWARKGVVAGRASSVVREILVRLAPTQEAGGST